MELLKLLSGSELVSQIVSFLILFFVLKKFFWVKILSSLDQRKETIAAEFKQLSDGKKEIAQLKAGLDEKLAAIDALAEKKIQEAVAAGRTITDELRKTAQLDAEKIIENARQNIRNELSKAKEELKEQIIDVSLRAAENVIQEKLTEEQDKKLVADFLTKIDELK